MKTATYTYKTLTLLCFACLLALLLLGCGDPAERGSCNQFCGNTQIASSQTQKSCAERGAKSTCPTQWLPRGADENDRNAWIRVYPVPLDTSPDTKAPKRPSVSIELIASNEISIVAIPNSSDTDITFYEIARNGEMIIRSQQNLRFHTDSNLNELTQYCYTVVARDAAGNRSTKSSKKCLNTIASPVKKIIEFPLSARNSYLSIAGENGTIYNGKDFGISDALSAINPDGSLKWTSEFAKTDNRIAPVLDSQGNIYTKNKLTVYSTATDGTLNWSYTFDTSSSLATLKTNNNTLYVDVLAGVKIIEGVTKVAPHNVTALNLNNGSFKWEYNDKDESFLFLSAIGKDGSAYLELNRSATAGFFYFEKIQTLNAEDGSLEWEYEDSEKKAVSLKIVSDDGNVYLESKVAGATFKDDVYTLQALKNNGILNWEYATNSRMVAPAIDANKIYVSTELTSILSPNYRKGLLEALDFNGALQWSYSVSDNDFNNISNVYNFSFSTPVIGNDGTLYISDSFKLHALNSDGSVKWINRDSYDRNYTVSRTEPIIISGNSIFYTDYFAGAQTRLNAYTLDGSLKWTYAIKGFQQPFLVLDEILMFGEPNIYTFDTQ